MELRQNVDYYTKSNETLKERNDELQLMLDEARAKIAVMATNHLGNQKIDNAVDVPVPIQSPVVTTIQNQNQTVIAIATNDLDPAPGPAVTISEAAVHFRVDEIISDNSGSGSDGDDCCDYIDFLLENDDWFKTDNDNDLEQNHPQQGAHITGPMEALSCSSMATDAMSMMITSGDDQKPKHQQQPRRRKTKAKQQQTTRNDSHRREKNREAARKARKMKKAEHEKLHQSVAFFTRSNEMLKKKNEELQLMILSARSKTQNLATALASDAATMEMNTNDNPSIHDENPKQIQYDHCQSVEDPQCGRHCMSRRSHSSDISVGKTDLDDAGGDNIMINADAAHPDIEHWVSYLLE